MKLGALWSDLLAAVEFLTRLPVPSRPYQDDSLVRSLKFFPLVGLFLGACAAAFDLLLAAHLPTLAVATFVIALLIVLTGGFHEDALADTADGFGGGWNREQILTILRDSRIGSYGGVALVLSLIARVVLLSSLPRVGVLPVLMTAHVLCRWTTLPLSYYLAPARLDNATAANGQGARGKGQGARVAGLTTTSTLVGGTLFSFACAAVLLRWQAVGAILIAILVTLLSGLYYRRRIGGVTGDCFGATNQLTEIAVYLCGVWA